MGDAEIVSTGKCKYGKVKYRVAKCVWVENTSTENGNTSEHSLSRVGKCKYGKIEYGITAVTFFDNNQLKCCGWLVRGWGSHRSAGARDD